MVYGSRVFVQFMQGAHPSPWPKLEWESGHDPRNSPWYGLSPTSKALHFADAAPHVDFGAGDVGRILGSKKRDGAGDFLRFSNALHRHRSENSLNQLFGGLFIQT
jgi:hypothetical protein